MVLRAHPLGDVAAFGEDAGNPAMCIADRLKDEIDEALFRPPCRIPLQIDGQTAADERLLRFVDLVEKLIEAHYEIISIGRVATKVECECVLSLMICFGIILKNQNWNLVG